MQEWHLLAQSNAIDIVLLPHKKRKEAALDGILHNRRRCLKKTSTGNEERNEAYTRFARMRLQSIVLLTLLAASLQLPTIVHGESRGALFCEDDSSIDTEHGKYGPDDSRIGAVRACYSIYEESEEDERREKKKQRQLFWSSESSTSTSVSIDDECIVDDIESEDSFDEFRRFEFARFYQIHCEGDTRVGLCEYKSRKVEDEANPDETITEYYWKVEEKCSSGKEGVVMLVNDRNRNLRGEGGKHEEQQDEAQRKLNEYYPDPEGTFTVEVDGGGMWKILP